ncbi:MAG: hypothetical protein ABL901_04295 [Hyphomicrobiaceae bacterium]
MPDRDVGVTATNASEYRHFADGSSEIHSRTSAGNVIAARSNSATSDVNLRPHPEALNT